MYCFGEGRANCAGVRGNISPKKLPNRGQFLIYMSLAHREVRLSSYAVRLATGF